MNEQVKQYNRNRFGIIQLSDLQFGKNHSFGDSTNFVCKLAGDIRAISKEYNFRPIYLVLSGDISETGHAEEFAEASKIICDLCEELHIDRKKLLCIPGNHDINWNLSKHSEEAGDEQLKYLPYNNFVSAITGRKEHLTGDRYVSIVDNILKPEFEAADQSELINYDRIELEILLLNSCEKEDHENHEGYVCHHKLQKTLQVEKSRKRLKIAILHHRLDNSIPDKRSAIINAGDIEAILASNRYNIVLTGHVHQGLVHAIEKSNGHKIIYAGCGSTGANKNQRSDGIQNQYCIHVIDFDENKFHSIWRAYNPSLETEYGLGAWTKDNSFDLNPTTFSLSLDKTLPLDQTKVKDSNATEINMSLKTEREKMKLAFLNLLGGWKQNG